MTALSICRSAARGGAFQICEGSGTQAGAMAPWLARREPHIDRAAGGENKSKQKKTRKNNLWFFLSESSAGRRP